MASLNKSLGPFHGIDNTSTEAAVKPTFVEATDNGYFDNNNAFVPRPGYIVRDAGAANSLHSYQGLAYYVRDCLLYQYGIGGAQEIGELPVNSATYADFADELYVSSGGKLFRVSAGALCPASADVPQHPVVKATTGDLRAGTYGVALAAVEPASGLGDITWIDLPDGSGLQVSVPAGRYTIYGTTGDGSSFYSVATVDGPCVADIGEEPAGYLCPVEFLTPPPHHDAIYAWNAYLLFRFGCNIHLSTQFSGGLCDARRYLPFPDPVTHVFPLPTGLFVQTASALYWCAGTDPDSLEVKEVRRGTGALDLGTVTDAHQVHGERSGKVAVGMIGGEFFAGYEDGTTERLSAQYRAKAPGAGKAALVRFSSNPLFYITNR